MNNKKCSTVNIIHLAISIQTIPTSSPTLYIFDERSPASSELSDADVNTSYFSSSSELSEPDDERSDGE